MIVCLFVCLLVCCRCLSLFVVVCRCLLLLLLLLLLLVVVVSCIVVAVSVVMWQSAHACMEKGKLVADLLDDKYRSVHNTKNVYEHISPQVSENGECKMI